MPDKIPPLDAPLDTAVYLQDVLEEMEEVYDKHKGAMKDVMKAKDIQVIEGSHWDYLVRVCFELDMPVGKLSRDTASHP